MNEDRVRATQGMVLILHIDTDDSRQRQIGRRFGLFRYTKYVLANGEGEILTQWNGYLNLEEVAVAIDEFLS